MTNVARVRPSALASAPCMATCFTQGIQGRAHVYISRNPRIFFPFLKQNTGIFIGSKQQFFFITKRVFFSFNQIHKPFLKQKPYLFRYKNDPERKEIPLHRRITHSNRCRGRRGNIQTVLTKVREGEGGGGGQTRGR